MARNKAQAWLTCVTNDDSVISALVLAESLRRTRTNKRISVIASVNLSWESKLILRQAFDDVFWLDTSGIRNNDDLEYSAKMYAFSLEIFGKCVFLDGNTIVMENSDGLFDGREFFKSLMINSSENKSTLDLFLFAPSKSLFNHFESNFNEKLIKSGVSSSSISGCAVILDGIENWMKNNLSSNKARLEDNSNCKLGFTGIVSEMCLKKGRVLMQNGNIEKPEIIHFTGLSEMEKGEFPKIVKNILKNSEFLGIMEKIILETWLNIYETNVSKFLQSPSSNLLNCGTLTQTHYENEPIAIIGMSCRFPGANNLEEFWNLLNSSQEGIRTPPPFRWKREHSIFGISGKERSTNAGFLPCPVDLFDAKFFGVSPKEALFLDPQARLLHEVLWESLECAGINPQDLYGSHTGIFTGSWMNDYRDIVQRSSEDLDFFRTYMGNSMGATAARLSFLLGLTGPSIATESGCSSAIVGVDLAVKSLRSGEINLALVGGVNLLLHPFESDVIDYVISPDGRCKTFDEGADGFGRAEGCGVLVLKRLSEALKDGDNVWAMIRGSAVSQEGMSRSLGTPTVDCEALAMKLALRDAGVEKEQVSFVETHGTGTSVGDPMEVAAICKAYKSGKRKGKLVIGSVKTNVGHTESCSGITGIIKTVLSMRNEVIPKHLNLERVNPQIDLESIPAVIPLERVEWPKVEGERRLAGVSSFGITGTDGHVILEEAPEEEGLEGTRWEWGMERPLHIMRISAKSKESLEGLIKLYQVAFQDGRGKGQLADAAYTANTGRALFKFKAFLIAGDSEQAGRILERGDVTRGDETTAIEMESGKKICFLFTGQGSQYKGMGKILYETSPVFRIYFEKCEEILRGKYGLSIGPVIWGDGDEINRTKYSQIAIFCLEWCLLKLWESWGIKPDIVLGHSAGEFCAAVAAGVVSFEDGLKLVTERSRLIDGVKEGRMLAVKGSKPEVEKLIREFILELDVAAVNSEEQIVVAGDIGEIERFLGILGEKGIKAVVLDSTHAFHSRHMDTMLEEYRSIASGVKIKEGACQYISGVEGRLLEDPASEMDSDYWVRHTREKVSFLEACEALRKMECWNFLEIGGHPIVSTFVMQNIGDIGGISCYPSLRRNKNDWQTMLESLGRLFLKGHTIDWNGFDKTYNRKKISWLPGYPFQRKGYWVACDQICMPNVHPLLGHLVENASSLRIFEGRVRIGEVGYLRDHCIGNMVVFPGAGFTEMCMAAGYCVADGLTDNLDRPRHAIQLENVRIEQPLELREGKGCRMQTIVKMVEDLEGKSQPSGYEVKIYHQNEKGDGDEGIREKDWVLHATALFHPCLGGGWKGKEEGVQERIREIMEGKDGEDTDGFYRSVDNAGLKFGEKFKSLRKQWREGKGVEGGMDEIVVEMMEVPEDWEKYVLHPVVIDAMIQSGLLSGWREGEKGQGLRVPLGIGRLTVFGGNLGDGGGKMYLYTRWEDGVNCRVVLVNGGLEVVAVLEGLEVIETNVKTIQSVLEIQRRELPDSWEETWKQVNGPNDNKVELAALEEIFRDEEFKRRVDEKGVELKEEDRGWMRKMDRLVYLYTLKALYEMGWRPEEGEKWNVKEFCERWNILGYFGQQVHFYFLMMGKEGENMMEFEEEEGTWLVKGRGLELGEIEKEADGLFEELVAVDKLKIIVNIYKNIGGQLGKILRGEESVLTMLYPQGSEGQEYSAEMYYQNYPSRKEVESVGLEISETILRRMYDLNCESTSGPASKGVLRVLEVGAGTGSMTGAILPQIGEIWGGKFEYYYTDISASFFAKAEKRLEGWKDNLKFGIFDVEDSPLGQGIPLNYFDIVLASDVLHATRDLEECVRNLRQCLRARGTMHFTEGLAMDWGITFVFGLFEGYWRFVDFEDRPYHCCVDGGKWREILKRSGFNFVNVQEVYMGMMGCVTAEASDCPGTEISKVVRKVSEVEVKTEKKWLVFYPVDEDSCEVIDKVIEIALRCGGIRVEKVMMPENGDEETLTTHVTAALKKSEMQMIIYCWGLSREEINQRKIALPLMLIAQYVLGLKKAPKLYVLTRGVHSFKEEIGDGELFNPSSATLFGMVKSLKNESSDLFVRYVDLGMDINLEEILWEIGMNKEGGEKDRVQVTYRDEVRFEPRFNRANLEGKVKGDLEIPRNSDRYKLRLPESRLIGDLVFEGLGDDGVVRENEVGVRVKAYALNFRDVFAVLKPTEEFEGMNVVGLDFAGVVSKVGEGVEDFKVGDRVFGANFKGGQLNSEVVIEKEFLMGVPKEMSFEEAATLPAVFSTSLYCLLNVARMKEGETVLIHTGSGGVGLAAIQLAKRVGARVVTTAGSTRKRRFLRGLGIEHVFHSRNTDYETEIMRVTQGRGVDIVLNSLTGEGFKEASLRCLGKGGRFVEMSKLGVWRVEEVKEIREDVEYSVVDLTGLEKGRWKELVEAMKEELGRSWVKHVPYVKFDGLRVRQALGYLQRAKHIGKVVVTMPEVRVRDGERRVEVELFNGESTYVITGGMGGIGWEVCKWMLGKGATDVVLIGRKGPKPEVAREIEELNGKFGFNVRVKEGDVGDEDRCRDIFREIKEEGKPIRGVHHCAGVLRDGLYGSLGWGDFEEVYRPKVQGTWNLHRVGVEMGLNLEFFVFYSSITALAGTPGQPNHSSGNCFEDAFAHYRYSLGLPGTSVNWGQWSQVGCAKETNVTGVLPVSVKRMLNGLEEVLRGNVRQAAFGEFESLAMWSVVVPLFKHYLDERLVRSLEGDGDRRGSGVGGGLSSEKFWEEMDGKKGREEKMGVVGVYMKRILREGLRMERDEEIGDDQNMKDLGVDSLMLIELKNSIQGLLGGRLKVSAGILKDCNTIRELSRCIVDKLYEDEEEENKVEKELTKEELVELIEMDCKLEENVMPGKPMPLPVDLGNIQTILITGATGQLGPYILKGLVKNYGDRVNKIVCLIRTKDGEKPEVKLKGVMEDMNLGDEMDWGKVRCVKGDVTLDRFGMDGEEYNRLSEEVDGVIHLVAKSNHVEAYRKIEGVTGSEEDGDDVRSVNVGGTTNLIRFCGEGKTKCIYYASSILAVFGGKKEDGRLCDKWPEMGEIEKMTENRITGYPISKWVGEMLLRQASERGIPCKIFRFPWIMGNSETGRLNYLRNHYILRFLSYLKVGSMPMAPVPAIILPVDICADLSLELFWDEGADWEIYNICHPEPELEVEFVGVAREEWGREVEVVDWEVDGFLERLYGKGMPLEVLKEIYEDIDRIVGVTSSDHFQAIQGYLIGPEMFFRSEKVERRVKGFRERCGRTMDIIRRDLRYVKEKGFFSRFGL